MTTRNSKGRLKVCASPSIALLGLLAALSGCQKQKGPNAPGSAQTDEAGQQVSEVRAAPDDTYVSLSGTVVEARPSSFLLDYGGGTIMVEMDDWDFAKEGRALMDDDQVVVYGVVDDDFYERRTIEAGSVYVEDLGTQFYANSVDEEDFPVIANVAPEPTLVVSGTVGDVSGDEFVLHTAGGPLDVNVKSMLYNPLDDEGYQQLEEGDRVSVSGRLGVELFDDLDLMADTVVTLRSSDDEM